MSKSSSFPAKAVIDEDQDGGFHLTIELANGFYVAIDCWPDDEHPQCSLLDHTGNGSEPEYFGVEEFKEWAEIATGKQPLKNRGRYRKCPDCGESFHDVPSSPMLTDEVWLRLANRNECLCVSCLQRRAQKLEIKLTIEALRPCPINYPYLADWIETKKRLPPNADEWRKALAAVGWSSELLDQPPTEPEATP